MNGRGTLVGHDQLFKTLLRRFFADFVRIVLPEAMSRRLRLDAPRFLDRELYTDLVDGEERRLDLVAQLETTGGEAELLVIHVEVEARARKAMGRRMWRYAMQLRLRHGKPVVPMVLYLRGGPADVTAVTVEERFEDQHLASFTYFAFGLSRSDAPEYLERPEPLSWALASLMRRRTLSPARHKLACLRRIARAAIDDAGRFLLVNCVETYVQLDGEAREEYERLLADEPNREVTIMEMTWADTLEAKGVEKGLEKGRLEGMRTLLLGMLERRFGPLPEGARKHLGAIDSPEELSELGDRVLDARTLDDLGL
jgi:hypothetical protein